MENFSEKLDQLKKKMNENLLEDLKKNMVDVTRKLNYLSKMQENNISQCEQSSVNQEQIKNIARDQQEISKNLEKVSQQISEIASKTFFLPPNAQQIVNDAIKKSQSSIQELSRSSCRTAGQKQKEAMAQMNRASSLVLSSMNKMNESCNNPSSCPSGSESFFSQMESMCQGQSGLNNEPCL